MAIKKTKGLAPLGVERLIQSLNHIIKQNKALMVSETKQHDLERSKEVFNHFGLRDYLVVVRGGGYIIYPLRTGLYCSVENTDEVFLIASNGEACEVESSMANRLLETPPLLHRLMTIEHITNEVKKTLELKAWMGWHCEHFYPTTSDSWDKWKKYFARIDNPIMVKYLERATLMIEQKSKQETEDQQSAN